MSTDKTTSPTSSLGGKFKGIFSQKGKASPSAAVLTLPSAAKKRAARRRNASSTPSPTEPVSAPAPLAPRTRKRVDSGCSVSSVRTVRGASPNKHARRGRSSSKDSVRTLTERAPENANRLKRSPSSLSLDLALGPASPRVDTAVAEGAPYKRGRSEHRGQGRIEFPAAKPATAVEKLQEVKNTIERSRKALSTLTATMKARDALASTRSSPPKSQPEEPVNTTSDSSALVAAMAAAPPQDEAIGEIEDEIEDEDLEVDMDEDHEEELWEYERFLAPQKREKAAGAILLALAAEIAKENEEPPLGTFADAWLDNKDMDQRWQPGRFELSACLSSTHYTFWDQKMDEERHIYCYLVVRDMFLPRGITRPFYEDPPLQTMNVSFWSSLDNTPYDAENPSLDYQREQEAAEYHVRYQDHKVSAEKVANGTAELSSSKGIALVPTWEWHAPSAEDDRSAHLLKLIIPVPMGLFERCEYRLFRMHATMRFGVDDSEKVKLTELEAESDVVDVPIEHLKKEIHMDGKRPAASRRSGSSSIYGL